MDKRILKAGPYCGVKIACGRDDVSPMYANDGILYVRGKSIQNEYFFGGNGRPRIIATFLRRHAGAPQIPPKPRRILNLTGHPRGNL
jgi:hypothetical protein